MRAFYEEGGCYLCGNNTSAPYSDERGTKEWTYVHAHSQTF